MKSRRKAAARSTLRRKHRLLYDPVLAARLLKQSGADRENSRSRKITHIVSVAVSVFAKEGMAGFSMRRIATDAGVTLSTLQHYFGNRKNLMIVTINALFAQYIADYTAISRDVGRPARERLKAVVDDMLALLVDPLVQSFYVQLWAAALNDESIRELVKDLYTKYYGALGEIIGQIRPDWPQERAALVGVRIGSHIDGFLVTLMLAPYTPVSWEDMRADFERAWVKAIEA